jgi:hypothetical protein
MPARPPDAVCRGACLPCSRIPGRRWFKAGATV